MDKLAWLYNPDSKPSEDLPEHDQRMIQLGWDAHRTLEPQPDQPSRLLTANEFTECAEDVPNTTLGEQAGAPWIFGAKLIEKQDAKYVDVIADMYLVGIKRGKTESKECIEALNSSMRRFWAKVEVCSNGCWEWRGATNGKGYGQFWNGERVMPAHRFLYELFIKKIEADLEPDHLCRNKKFVNPSHLEAVTHRENLRRGIDRQHWLKKTHCKHGHQ